MFRLAALLYLHMVSEVPPRAYPVLLLVRKMLSLLVVLSVIIEYRTSGSGLVVRFRRFEVIVNEKLPGLCSCHFALYVVSFSRCSMSRCAQAHSLSCRCISTRRLSFRLILNSMIDNARRKSSIITCKHSPSSIQRDQERLLTRLGQE